MAGRSDWRDPVRMEIGEIICRARYERAMTQRRLAELAGVSPGAVSQIETGRRQPTLQLADKILAVIGLQLHVESQPLWRDIDAEIDAARRLTLDQRMCQWPVNMAGWAAKLNELPVVRHELVELWAAEGEDLWEPEGIWGGGSAGATCAAITSEPAFAYAMEGLAAAAMQGAPVPVKSFDIALSSDNATLEAFNHILRTKFVTDRWDDTKQMWGGVRLDPRERGALRWRSPGFGELRARLVNEVTPDLFVEVPHRFIEDGTVRIPMVGLARVETTDRWAARVLTRMRGTPVN